MSVRVTIVEGPLGPWLHEGPPGEPGRCGAALVFEGVVREDEAGRPLKALRYEAYRPMAEETIERLAGGLVDKRGLAAMTVEHSVGTVPVGSRSFRAVIWAAHRKEALAAMDEFIDALKAEVPIWKKPVWAARGGA